MDSGASHWQVQLASSTQAGLSAGPVSVLIRSSAVMMYAGVGAWSRMGGNRWLFLTIDVRRAFVERNFCSVGVVCESGQMLSSRPWFASSSALLLPSIPEWPGTQLSEMGAVCDFSMSAEALAYG